MMYDQSSIYIYRIVEVIIATSWLRAWQTMADEGEEQEGAEDARMQLVQQYCLKTIKQVGRLW
jgi:hypothetical protein